MTAPTALVLGAAVWAGGVASPALKRRAMHGVQLFHNGQIGHIIGCGAVGKHGPSEAQVIRQICLDNAVPDSCISLEEQSTNTYENIRNAMALLDSKSVIIITDKYHAPRARMTAKHLGLSATSSSPTINPASGHAVIKSYLREASALVICRVRFWKSRQGK